MIGRRFLAGRWLFSRLTAAACCAFGVLRGSPAAASDEEIDRSSSAVQAPDAGDWTDALTGTDGPRLWDRLLASEVARVRRYRRPATVALAEIVGLDSCEAVWGAEIAERAFVRLARTLATEIRSSDHIARIDRTRFGILLTETDEIAAVRK